jgi:hypothetical protein
VREAVAFEILWVFVVLVEIFDDSPLTRPHENFVIRVTEVVSETTSKVSSAEYEDFGLRGR